MAVALEHEIPVLNEFRAIMSDLNADDTTLLRFLRARDLNLKKSEEMLRKCAEWRETKDIESLAKWNPPEDIVKEFRLYFTGIDSNGFPVYLLPFGKWDGRKILGKGLKEESIKFMYKSLEIIMAKCRDVGVSKFTIIFDNDGLTLWKCAHWDSVECTIRVIKEFEANYPETMVNAFLVNTPTVFWQAFKFVKPVLAGNTLKKIHIHDTDSKKWIPALLEHLPAEALPNAYGGNAQAFDVHV